MTGLAGSSSRARGGAGATWALWLLVMMALFAVTLYVQRTPDNDVRWVRGAAGLEAMGEPNRPVLLYFTAEWCGPCKMMRKAVWPDERVERAVNTAVVPVYVDVDDPSNRPLVAEHRVEAMPTFLLIRDGRPMARMTGYLNADQVIALTRAAE